VSADAWRRFAAIAIPLLVLLGAQPAALRAQDQPQASPIVDSIAVVGNSRISTDQIVSVSAIQVFQPVNYRGIQRAITNLYLSGQFDDVKKPTRTSC
jgi:outer membrane protein assembly factor BamA